VSPASRLRTVRVRITLVATLLTGVAVLLAAAWLTSAVEDSLTDNVRDADHARLGALARDIRQGEAPSNVDLADLEGRYIQVVVEGEVVVASPALRGLPPMTELASGGVVRFDAELRAVATGLPAGRLAVTEQDLSNDGRDVRLVAASPLSEVQRSVDAVRDGLLVAFPFLVALVAALAWGITGRALRPVEAIRREVESISGSTLDRRVPVPPSGDEVARLAETMNAMLDRLEDASLRQQRFVADASHELRSPVAAIRTELEVAQRTASAEEWPAVAERLLAEEARLEALIADLLLLASLDEGAPMPEPVVVDLADEAREEARRRGPDRTAVGIEVDASTPALVEGSRVQLRRALANLLDNAARHARSSVHVAVHQRDGHVRVLVDDDGPGIAEADRERVFQRFVRLDEHRARVPDRGGAGLGLSLVRRIAERHDGTASVDTAPLGGARFVLDLPAARPERSPG
jgi:signal transduction histidine kinase